MTGTWLAYGKGGSPFDSELVPLLPWGGTWQLCRTRSITWVNADGFVCLSMVTYHIDPVVVPE